MRRGADLETCVSDHSMHTDTSRLPDAPFPKKGCCSKPEFHTFHATDLQTTPTVVRPLMDLLTQVLSVRDAIGLIVDEFHHSIEQALSLYPARLNGMY